MDSNLNTSDWDGCQKRRDKPLHARAFGYICELLWPFIHAFLIHSFIHFNSNYIQAQLEALRIQQGPQSKTTFIWRLTARDLPCPYSPNASMLQSGIQSKLKVTHAVSHSWFLTETMFYGMIDFIGQQPCLWITWLPKIKSTWTGTIAQDLKRRQYTFRRSQFPKVLIS